MRYWTLMKYAQLIDDSKISSDSEYIVNSLDPDPGSRTLYFNHGIKLELESTESWVTINITDASLGRLKKTIQGYSILMKLINHDYGPNGVIY